MKYELCGEILIPFVPMNVGNFVTKLYILGKLSWDSAHVWDTMERSYGPVDGFIADGKFQYEGNLEKIVKAADFNDDVENTVICLVHHLINKELKELKEEVE